jgi:hypothetical protein
MIALLVALSFATPASHGHKAAHTHKHKHAPMHAHKHKRAPVHAHKHKHAPLDAAERCSADAEGVQTLERRIASAEVPQAEANTLERQLESAIELARRDCARE